MRSLFPPESQKIRINMNRVLRISAIALALVAFTWTATEARGKAMRKKATVVKTDANGFFDLSNAPTHAANYKVTKSINKDDVCTAEVWRGGKLFQTLLFEVSHKEKGLDNIGFYDVNGDGHLDILAGPFRSREWSYVFLWSPKHKQFVQASVNGQSNGALNGDFLYSPKQKVFFSYGAGSAAEYYIAKHKWNGTDIYPVETLYIFYGDIDNEHPYRYVLHKGNEEGKVMVKTNDKKKLPAEWRKMMKYNE